MYVSFNDGDQWQALQNNMPVTSVRDVVAHGDDLDVATHGRGFWVLDQMTPLRELAAKGGEVGGAAVRICSSPAKPSRSTMADRMVRRCRMRNRRK